MAHAANPQLTWYDYVIFGGTLAVSLAIGAYHALAGPGQRTTAAYLSGDRKMAAFPLAVSLVMSYVSGLSAMGVVAEVYSHGLQKWMSLVGEVVMDTMAALLLVPLLFPLKITSVFQYFEMRFQSRAVRLLGSTVLLFTQMIYLGLALYAPAVALATVSPIPVWAAIAVSGVIGTIYTAVGGIKAVVWTDAFQGFVMIAGLVAICIGGTIQSGGIQAVFTTIQDSGRQNLVVLDPNPLQRLNLWCLLVGGLYARLYVTTGQASVQRFCATPTLRQAKSVIWLAMGLNVVFYSLCFLCGVVIFAYYNVMGCDPLKTGQIRSSNQLLPFFVMDGLGLPALPGLFLAALYGGALSSVSSCMNSMAAVTWKDFMEHKFISCSEEKKAAILKVTAAAYGLLGILFAYASGHLGGNLLQICVVLLGSSAVPLSGILIMGALSSSANWIGALVGGVVSFVFSFSLGLGSTLLHPYRATLNTTVSQCWQHNLTVLSQNVTVDRDDVFVLFRLSFVLYPVLGLALCLLLGLVVSWLTGGSDIRQRDPHLLVSLYQRLCCCLPAGSGATAYYTVTVDAARNETGSVVAVGDNDVIMDTKTPGSDLELREGLRKVNSDVDTHFLLKDSSVTS